MKYCSDCGSHLKYMIPEGDHFYRFTCTRCGMIHYQNPRIVTGCIPVYQGQILLCRRAIEPRYGYWTVPAGFMENGEKAEEGAARETYEEANAEVRIQRLHTIYSIPHINQVHLFFLAEIEDGKFSPGTESLETRLYEPGRIPWSDLAFHSVRFALEKFTESDTQDCAAFIGSFVKPEDQPDYHGNKG